MLEIFAQNEAALRLGFFLSILGLMCLWEVLGPRRATGADRLHRWPTNLLILTVDNLMLRLLFPVLAVGAAVWAERTGTGLFNVMAMPFWAEAAAGLVLLDLALYVQHVVFHLVPFLWRFHRIHHIDTHVDATTGLRFHPVEIAISMGFKIAVVTALGVAPVVVIVFEIVLNGASLFTHANIRLRGAADHALRIFIVTPDMHRIHHSVIKRETDSNYGFGLSLWDRLFRTYRRDPAEGHLQMHLGQNGIGPETASNLWRSLTFPFKR